MKRILRKFRLEEISACDRPAVGGARALIMKRADDDDEQLSNIDLLRLLDEESRTAIERGEIPPIGDGPNSERLLAELHAITRAQPRLMLSDAVAVAFGELSEAEQAGVVEEAKAALAARLEEEKADEEQRSRIAGLVKVGVDEALGELLDKHGRVDAQIKELAMGGDVIVKAARKLVDEGVDLGVTKQMFEEKLLEVAKQVKRPGETDAAAVTRFLESPDGLALMKAARVAPVAAPKVEKRAAPVLTGAAAELAKLAAEFGKANPKASAAQAFTAVYTDPAHLELKKKYDAEDTIAKSAATADAVLPSAFVDFASYGTGEGDAPRPAPKGGPATQALNALARQYQLAHPGKSAAQAFTAVYTAPEFREFKIAYDAEQRGPVDYTTSRASAMHVA